MRKPELAPVQWRDALRGFADEELFPVWFDSIGDMALAFEDAGHLAGEQGVIGTRCVLGLGAWRVTVSTVETYHSSGIG
jgi:hypothetical protein